MLNDAGLTSTPSDDTETIYAEPVVNEADTSSNLSQYFSSMSIHNQSHGQHHQAHSDYVKNRQRGSSGGGQLLSDYFSSLSNVNAAASGEVASTHVRAVGKAIV